MMNQVSFFLIFLKPNSSLGVVDPFALPKLESAILPGHSFGVPPFLLLVIMPLPELLKCESIDRLRVHFEDPVQGPSLAKWWSHCLCGRHCVDRFLLVLGVRRSSIFIGLADSLMSWGAWGGYELHLWLWVMSLGPGVALIGGGAVEDSGPFLEIYFFTAWIALSAQFLQKLPKLLALYWIDGLLEKLLDAWILEEGLADGDMEVFEKIRNGCVVCGFDGKCGTGRVIFGRGGWLRIIIEVHWGSFWLCPCALLLHLSKDCRIFWSPAFWTNFSKTINTIE